MKRRATALAACLALFTTGGGLPAAAQRPPLFGVWLGGMQCGPNLGRYAKLFMYGNGIGLLELGVSPFTPDVKPAVATVALRQLPEADYVLIDRWMSNGVEPRPEFAGRIEADGSFSGQVFGDAHCDRFLLRPQTFPQALLMNMARTPLVAARREAAILDPPHMTAKEAIALGILGYAILSGVWGSGSEGGGSGGGGGSPPAAAANGNAAPLPRVGGNVHGNFDTDIHGNETQDLHGNTLRPRGY